MHDLIGFEEIIRAIIKNSAHAKNKNTGIEDIYTDEERYQAVMKAIFGKYHDEKETKIPNGYNHSDIEEILLNQKQGKKLSDCISETVKKRHPEIEEKLERSERVAKTTIRDRLIKSDYDAIQKHIQRHKNEYYWCNPKKFDLERYLPDADEVKEREQKIENIFSALREAGWPVYRDKNF